MWSWKRGTGSSPRASGSFWGGWPGSWGRRWRPWERLSCGGDEFVLLMPEVSAQGAEGAMVRLMGIFSRSRFSAGGEEYPLPAFGYGGAAFPPDGEGPAQLLSAADQALIRAKTRLV